MAREEFASPGARAELQRHARTFFAVDLPALLAYRVDRSGLAGVRCPVLLVGGSESEEWFGTAREYLALGLPRVEESIVAGAGHLVAATHPREVAGLITDFVHRHEVDFP